MMHACNYLLHIQSSCIVISLRSLQRKSFILMLARISPRPFCQTFRGKEKMYLTVTAFNSSIFISRQHPEI